MLISKSLMIKHLVTSKRKNKKKKKRKSPEEYSTTTDSVEGNREYEDKIEQL